MSPDSSKDLLSYTPMLHSRLFTETQKFRDHHFQPIKAGLSSPTRSTDTSADLYLDGHPQFDRPLFVQFCANSPDHLLEAARYVEPYCDAIDLNLGCPQGIAKKGNYGAFLQEDWDLIYKLINKLHTNLNVPVTAKMRVLESKEKTLEYAKMILSAGASVITVHGRQRDQKGHQTGLADWSVLRFLRQNLPPDTVIFANGNILQHDDIRRCLEETGADGVMSAEGNLYDPTIFAKPLDVGHEGREYWRGRDGKGGYRMDAVLRRYMDIIYKYVLEEPPPARKPLFLPSDPLHEDPPTHVNGSVNAYGDEPPAKRQKRHKSHVKPTSPNLLAMQPHLFHLLRALVSKHTDIRDALARSRAGDMAAYENVLSMVEAAIKQGLLDYEINLAKYEDSGILDEEEQKASMDKDESSLAAVRRCRRPWWVCQPYVRPLPKEAMEKGSLTMSKKDRRKMEAEKVLEMARNEQDKKCEREKLDEADGMERAEMPREAMVAG